MHQLQRAYNKLQDRFGWNSTTVVEDMDWRFLSYIEQHEQCIKEVNDPISHSHLKKERLAKVTRKLPFFRHNAQFTDTVLLFLKDFEHFIYNLMVWAKIAQPTSERSFLSFLHPNLELYFTS